MMFVLAQTAPRFEVSNSQALLALAAVVVLMAFHALFRSGETALASLRVARIRELIETKDPRGSRLQALSADSHYLAACQIGSRICKASMYTICVLASPWVARSISGREDYGVGWLIGSAFALVFIVGIANMVIPESFFGGLARKNAEAWAFRVAPILKVARFVLSPFIALVTGISSLLSQRFGMLPMFAAPPVTEEDLREMVEASGAEGGLIEDEKEMIHSIIEFTDTIAREVMTPRTDIDAVERSATASEVAQMIQETGHTRIPVYEGNIDRIVGTIHAKDLLSSILSGNGKDISAIIRPALFIPVTKDLHQLLQEFRRSRTLMAIVQDEFGGTAGLVTIEDLVEEIVGEIVDEYDVEEPEVQCLAANEWLIDGRAHLDDVNDEIGSNFESEEFDTVGGYIFGLFGRQPGQGESVEDGDWRLAVDETDGRRVLRVRASKGEPLA